jgi:hypothetical protein
MRHWYFVWVTACTVFAHLGVEELTTADGAAALPYFVLALVSAGVMVREFVHGVFGPGAQPATATPAPLRSKLALHHAR